MGKETKAILIIIFLILVTIGVIISKIIAGISGIVLLSLVSWIFFLLARDEMRDLRAVKEFLETGETRSDKFKVVSGIVKRAGL